VADWSSCRTPTHNTTLTWLLLVAVRTAARITLLQLLAVAQTVLLRLPAAVLLLLLFSQFAAGFCHTAAAADIYQLDRGRPTLLPITAALILTPLLLLLLYRAKTVFSRLHVEVLFPLFLNAIRDIPLFLLFLLLLFLNAVRDIPLFLLLLSLFLNAVRDIPLFLLLLLALFLNAVTDIPLFLLLLALFLNAVTHIPLFLLLHAVEGGNVSFLRLHAVDNLLVVLLLLLVLNIGKRQPPSFLFRVCSASFASMRLLWRRNIPLRLWRKLDIPLSLWRKLDVPLRLRRNLNIPLRLPRILNIPLRLLRRLNIPLRL
jgi:hypothetical protein